MTQSDFLQGTKFIFFIGLFVRSSDHWYSPLGKTKGVLKSATKQHTIIEIDKQGFCTTNSNRELYRIEFEDCKLIEVQ